MRCRMVSRVQHLRGWACHCDALHDRMQLRALCRHPSKHIPKVGLQAMPSQHVFLKSSDNICWGRAHTVYPMPRQFSDHKCRKRSTQSVCVPQGGEKHHHVRMWKLSSEYISQCIARRVHDVSCWRHISSRICGVFVVPMSQGLACHVWRWAAM